jgi:uncharacterized protein YndB with AHSA1/START domain
MSKGSACRRPVKAVTLTETMGEAGPHTTLTLLVTHATRQDRGAYLCTMDDGLQDAMDALAPSAGRWPGTSDRWPG